METNNRKDPPAHYPSIFIDGLWHNNVALGQMLALCPLLAVTTSATNGLGMGIATLVVMLSANLTASLLRDIVSPQVRIPVFIVLIAAIVTLVEMWLNAWMHELYKILAFHSADCHELCHFGARRILCFQTKSASGCGRCLSHGPGLYLGTGRCRWLSGNPR